MIIKGELSACTIIATLTALRALSRGGLRVGTLYCFEVVWSDGKHANKNALLHQVLNRNRLLFQNAFKRFGIISAF